MDKYAKYQLNWMIEHGHSIDDLMDCLQETWEMLNQEKEEGETISVTEAYEVWYDSFGFNHEIYACKSEWELNEELDN